MISKQSINHTLISIVYKKKRLLNSITLNQPTHDCSVICNASVCRWSGYRFDSRSKSRNSKKRRKLYTLHLFQMREINSINRGCLGPIQAHLINMRR